MRRDDVPEREEGEMVGVLWWGCEGRGEHTRRFACPVALAALPVEEVESDLPVRNSLPEGMLSAMMKVVLMEVSLLWIGTMAFSALSSRSLSRV